MGKINQLFRKPVELAMVIRLLNCFGLRGLDDRRSFCKLDLCQMETLKKLETEGVLPDLREFYLPCKARVYLDNITEKKAITVLKQVLRLHKHLLITRERNVSNHKVIFYNVGCMLDRHNKMMRIIGTNVLQFD